MLDLLKPDPSPRVLAGPLPAVRFAVGQTVLARDNRANHDKWLMGVITQRLGYYIFLLQVGDQYIKRHVDQMLPTPGPTTTEPAHPDERRPDEPPTHGPDSAQTVPVPAQIHSSPIIEQPQPESSPIIEPPSAADSEEDNGIEEQPEPPAAQQAVAPVPVPTPSRRSTRPPSLPKYLRKDFVLSKMFSQRGGVL